MPTSTLRYAVIGVGGISRMHLEAIATQPDVALVGLCDTADLAQWRLPTFADGLYAQRVLHALGESLRTRAWVAVS